MADLQLGIKISADGKGAKAEITSINGEIDKLSSGSKTATRNLQDTERSLNSLGSAASAAKGMLAAFATAATAKQILDTAKTIDQMRGTMQATSISTAAASANMAYVAKVSNTLGLEVVSASNAFAGLLAATKGTVLQGQATRDIFYSVAKAASALGKSAADTEGMLLAITQMMSKGKVSSEELRGQLGERLPGAFRMAAEAMGKTEAEFSKMLDTGEVVASEFLPKFAKALDEAYSDARFNRINQELNRLSNAWLDLKASLIDTDQIAKALALVTKSLENWNSVIGEKSLSQKINEEIKAITELSNSPKRFQFLFREETEKSIAAHQQALDELIKQQEKQNSVEDAATAGINKMSNSYVDAAAKAWKLTDAQKQVAAQIVEIAQAKGFDPSLLLSIAKAESSFDSLAKSSESTASGVFQFVKNTRERFGLADPFNVESSTNAAIKYLTVLEKQFDSTKLAIAGFKQGEGSVQQYGNTVPPQANGYVDKVMEGANQLDAALGKQQRSWTGVKDATNNANRAYQESVAAIEMLNKGTERALTLAQDNIDAKKNQLTVEYELFKKRLDAELEMAKTQPQKQAVLEKYRAEDEAYQQRAIKLIQERFDAEIAAAEAQRAGIQKSIDAAEKNFQSIDSINRLKAQSYEIDTRITDLQSRKSAAELQAASEILATQEMSTKQKQDEQSAIADMTLKYSQQLQMLQQINAARQQGMSGDTLAIYAQGINSASGLSDVVSSEGLQRVKDLAVAISDVQAQIKLVTPDLQNVQEEQLRINQAFQESVQQAQLFATQASQAFGSIGDAIGQVVLSVAQFGQQQMQVQRDMKKELEDLQKEGKLDPKTEAETRMKYATKEAQYQVAMYGDMANAAKNFFDKGTKGYKAMEAASKVFRAFEMALALKSMVTQLLGIETVSAAKTADTVKTVAEDATKAESEGVLAVIHQLTGGEVYTAIPRAAAVAAFVAALGVGIASASGGGSDSSAPVDNQGMGTVKGDPTAVSQSISESLQLLVDNSSNDLNYTAEMLKSLQAIQSAMGAATDAVAAKVTPALNDISSKLSGSGFSNAKLTEGGLYMPSQDLMKVLQKGVLSGYMYARTDSTSGLMGEFHSGKWQSAQYDRQLGELFGGVVKSVVKSFDEFGKAIGITSEQIIERLKGFKINIGKINLAGLSAEEVSKRIESVLSSMSDQVAAQVLPEFKDFQISGEGLYKTVVRVASGIIRANEEMAQLGMTAIDYTQIKKKQGDVEAEIVRQTLMSQGKLSDGTRKYVEGLTGSASDIIDSYKKLVDATNMMNAAGLNGNALDRTIINASGGVDALSSSLGTIMDSFLSAGASLSSQSAQLATTFNDLHQAMPANRAEFMALLQSLDLTTESGKRLFGQLITLVPAFDAVQKKIDDIKSKYRDIIDPMSQYLEKLNSIDEDFRGLLNSEIDRIKKSAKDGQDIVEQLADAEKAITQQKGAVLISTLESIWKSITNGIVNLQRSLASQIATLQGPGAVASLAGSNVSSAWGSVNSYIGSVKAGSPRNVSTEVGLLQNLQSAIMERYNAELALIQQAAQEQAQALQDGLQSQIDAINAATQAQIDAKTKENDAVLKGLQDQLDAANKLKSAIKQVQDYAKAMRLGSNSPLSPEGRLQAAQSQYNDLLRKANSGDAEAMAQLTSASDTYLQAAKEYYGSGTQYSNIFDGVQAAMEQLGAMNAPDPDSIQSHIDSLRESQQAELEQIRKAAQEQITVLQKDVAAQVKDLTDPNKNAAIAALKDSTIAELQKVQDLARITQEEANRQAKEAYDLAQKEYEFSFAQTQYLRAIAENMGITGLSSVSSHAKGGLASGLALVGEKGPELVNFSRPAQVMTAEETRRALSGDEETKTTLAAMLVEMKALVTTQSAANPQMVEKLSNMEARLSKMERNSRLIPA